MKGNSRRQTCRPFTYVNTSYICCLLAFLEFRLHKIRPLINVTREKFKAYYNPSKCQSIDEGMVRYKGQHYARQFTPCKPIKRGLKVPMQFDGADLISSRGRGSCFIIMISNVS